LIGWIFFGPIGLPSRARARHDDADETMRSAV
jgi:hypothetical protein